MTEEYVNREYVDSTHTCNTEVPLSDQEWMQFIRAYHRTAKEQRSFTNTLLTFIFIQLCFLTYRMIP